MKHKALIVSVLVALAFAGVAAAYSLRTVYIKPGHCTTISKTKVCALAQKPAIHQVTQTVTVTTTPPPPPAPTVFNFSGQGETTLAPVTLAKPATIVWTCTGYLAGINTNEGDFGLGGNGYGSGYLPAGTVSISVFGHRIVDDHDHGTALSGQARRRRPVRVVARKGVRPFSHPDTRTPRKMTDRLLNAREVADRWGVSADAVRDRWQAGEIPGFRIFGAKGGPVRFREAEIVALEESWRRGPRPEKNG
jgi:hypothetical protein